MNLNIKRKIGLWLKHQEERLRHINRNIIIDKGKKDTLLFLDSQLEIKNHFLGFKKSQNDLKDAIETLNRMVFRNQFSDSHGIPRLHLNTEFCPYQKYFILDDKYFQTEIYEIQDFIYEVRLAKDNCENHCKFFDDIINAANFQEQFLHHIMNDLKNGYETVKKKEPNWRIESKKEYENVNDDRRVLQFTDDAAPDPVTSPIPIDSDEDEDMGVNNDSDDDDFVQTTKRSRSRSPTNDTRSLFLRQRTDIRVTTSQTNVPSLFKRSIGSNIQNPQEIVSVEPSVSSLYTASLNRPIYLKLNEDTAIAASDLLYECKKDATGDFVQSGKMIYSSFEEIFGKDTYGEIMHGAESGMDYWYKHEDNHVRITELKKIFDMEIFEMDGTDYGRKKVSDETEIMIISMKIHEQSRADFQAGKITITKKRSLV